MIRGATSRMSIQKNRISVTHPTTRISATPANPDGNDRRPDSSMSKRGHSLQIVLLPLAAALICLCIALLTSQLIRDVTLAPLQRDEAEFLHTAWLMYGGSAIYKDFFQHHSPLFFVILSKAVSNASDLEWVYAIRLIHFAGIALVIGLVFSLITAAQPKASNHPSYSLAIGLLLVFTLWAIKPMATFQIRPELWALISWLIAWRLVVFPDDKSGTPCPSPWSGGSDKTNGGKALTPLPVPANIGKPAHGTHGGIAGRVALFIACLLLGAAAAFTPRSIPVVLALLVLSSWLRAETATRRLRVFFSALSMTATSWAVLTFSFVSLEQYVKWVIHFSRASGPRVSIWGQLPTAHTALMIIILAMAIGQLTRSANRHKNIFAPGIGHAAAIFVIFSAVGTWLGFKAVFPKPEFHAACRDRTDRQKRFTMASIDSERICRPVRSCMALDARHLPGHIGRFQHAAGRSTLHADKPATSTRQDNDGLEFT